MRFDHPMEQPEFVRTLNDILEAMRRRRLAGEFGLSAPKAAEFHGRQDYDFRLWED